MAESQPHSAMHRSARVQAFLTTRIQAMSQGLLKPIDAASLGAFRILFGAIMLWEAYRYYHYDRIFRYYIQPQFWFPYEFFPFLSPLPGHGMYDVFLVMALSATGIMLGLFYRISAILFFITYTYVFLLDKAQYNNHYYLVCLVAFLLIFVDAHRWASLDQKWRPHAQAGVIPYWQLFILRSQLFLVYFFGGIAKINADWLVGEPIRSWLRARSHYPLVGQTFFTSEIGVAFFAYGGLFFDLTIGFLLLWRRTRLVAFLFILFFNLTNKWLFNIGIFPYMMIACTILFVEPDFPRRILRRASFSVPETLPSPAKFYRPLVFGFVTLYLVVQILLPFRHWLYRGEVSWTEQGHRFSWHMKLRSKSGKLTITVTDPQTGESWQDDPSGKLSTRQLKRMETHPDMILYYVQRLKKELEQEGISNPIIKVDALVSLNGRPSQQLINSEVNLAEKTWTVFSSSDWIIPLQTTVSPKVHQVSPDAVE